MVGAMLALFVPAAASATSLPATITEDTTLTSAGNPYIGDTTVKPGVTLTIEPGVEVEEAEFYVEGTLKAEGTAEEPIHLDGSIYGAVIFEPGSGASVLDHVEIVGAGYNGCCGAIYPAVKVKSSSPTITNSTIDESAWVGVYVIGGGSAPEIADNDILDSVERGILFEAALAQPGEVNIHDNFVEGGGGGIEVNAFTSYMKGKALGGNIVVGTEGPGLTYKGPDIPDGITDNTLSGNANNKIQISGNVAHSSTWGYGGSVAKLSSGVTVESGVTLTIEPGVEVEEAQFVVEGTLKAEGTAEEPIYLDGSAYSAVAFEPGSGASALDHVEIDKAGSVACCGAIYAAVSVKGSSPTITNSTIDESGWVGIYVRNSGSYPEIADNIIIGSVEQGILFESGLNQTGEVNIHDNYVEGGGAGIEVNAFTSKLEGKALGGNTVIGTKGVGLSYKGPDIPDGITDNTLSGNANNKIQISGNVAHSSTWGDGGSVAKFTGSVTIESGVTLTIDPGVEIEETQFAVEGTLKADGTAEEPIFLDGSIYNAISFQTGSGSSLLDYVEIDKAGLNECCGGTFAAVKVQGSSPTITNSTIRRSVYAAIDVRGSSSPKIERNRFRDNGVAIDYSGSGELSAPNNDWGCASGPRPAGCGDSVTSNVKWEPPVQLPELNAHCRGEDSQCPKGADPVSLATGDLTYSHRDLLLTNKSDIPLEFTRAYSSGSDADTGLGPGWAQTGLASATELASGAVLILRQDGRQDLFYKVGAEYKAPSGVTDSLAKVEGTFRLTTLEGAVYAFDASGRIATITDDHGLLTTYGYNENGRLASITDPSSQTLTFSYNGSNHITAVKDSTGREIAFAYNEAGELKSVTDALGGVTKYEYDGQHRIKAITDPRGNVILKNTYDGQGRIVEQRDGLNNLWKLEYKAGETIVTQPEGGELAYGFDAQSRVISETDQMGKTTTTDYDAAGNVDEVLRPGGAKWEFGHDPAGNLTSVFDPESGERSYEYDGQNHLTEFTDERGKTWEYEWSEENDLEKVTDPEEGETTLEYDPAGQPIAVVDANEGKSEFGYDARGNLESVTDPLEHETTFEYDARNHLIKRTAPGLAPEELERNAYGDLLSRTTPEGHEIEYFYDPNGMLEEVIDPEEEVWRIEHDEMERPIEYVDPLEGTTEIEYDGNLNPISVLDRRGKETTYGYDPANRLTEVHRPEGGDWEFGYDARGNRESVLDPRGNETTYEYDLLDRMTDADEPLGVSTDYEYDPAGNLIGVTDPRSNETTYEYDDLGRLEEIDQPLGKTTSFGYDPLGNLLNRTTAEATLEYDYDGANRLREVSAGETLLRGFDYDEANRLTDAMGPQGDEIEIGYDDDGLVTSIDDGRGSSLSREYDSRGDLIEQVDPRGALEYEYDELGRISDLVDPSGAFGFEYDPEGNLTDVERPNGVATHNAYDNAGRLESTISKLGESTLESLQYEYDPAGNREAQVDRLVQETTYEYDALNRLTEFNPPGEGSTKYDYDPAGNRTEAGALTYEFNALNQLTEASDGTVYDYDEDGRLSDVENGEEATAYEWDPFDHLAKVETPGGAAEYSYDALGRLTERSEGAAARETHYGDLTDLPSYDADSEGELSTGYVRGAGGLLEEAGEASSYPLADAHGDVVALTEEGGGVASRQSYDPWGTQLSGPSLEMGWLGAYERRADPLSGLVQMGVRSYGPELGAFLSEDPVLGHLGKGTSVDRYLYAWDNPLKRYDLNGRDVCVPTPLGDACAGDAAEDVGSAAEDAVNSGQHLVSESQEYWVESDSPLSYVAGPAVSMVDLAINPDRLDYYLKSNNLPGKGILGDCYGSGHPARTIGAAAGAVGGSVMGVASGVGDLGVRAVGVGAVSGAAGAAAGGTIGTLGGCVFGAASGLIG
jgi:RHS repeat-associated protein